MANNSQTLMDIFQKIWAASGNNSVTENVVNETQIITALRENAASGGAHDLEILLIRMMNDAKRFNITINTETCGYCEGGFRDVIETYNSIHGYVSLMVRYIYIVDFLMCAHL